MDWSRLIQPLTFAGLVSMMLSMGCVVTPSELGTAMRSGRRLWAGLLSNFVFVPAVTVALLGLFDSAPLVSAGFLILAVCPGAPVSPMFTATARGDVAYAAGLMVLLAGLSAVLAPLLLAVLLPWVAPSSDLSIDSLAILRSLLLTQLLPLAAGLGLHAFRPPLADRLQRPLGAIANLLLLGVVGLVLVREFDALGQIRLRGWFGMLLLLAASLGIGWICGGPDTVTRKTLALTTAARNAGVALVIVTGRFAGTVAATAVVAYALVSVFGTLVAAWLLGRVAGSPAESSKSEIPNRSAGASHPTTGESLRF